MAVGTLGGEGGQGKGRAKGLSFPFVPVVRQTGSLVITLRVDSRTPQKLRSLTIYACVRTSSCDPS